MSLRSTEESLEAALQGSLLSQNSGFINEKKWDDDNQENSETTKDMNCEWDVKLHKFLSWGRGGSERSCWCVDTQSKKTTVEKFHIDLDIWPNKSLYVGGQSSSMK